VRTLPLYDGPLRAAIQDATPFERNVACTRCALHHNARNVCLPVTGDTDDPVGGLLTVGLYPGYEEDMAGLPNVGQSGTYLRRLIPKWWDGPIAHTNSLLCFPGSAKIEPRHVDACRGYVAEHVRLIRPRRVIAMGAWAIYSLLGRMPAINSVRRGFGWLAGEDDTQDPPVPVIFLQHPAAAIRNRFIAEDFERDLEWALTTPDAFFEERYIALRTGKVALVESESAAKMVCRELKKYIQGGGEERAISWDVESVGRLFRPDFKIISLAVCPNGSNFAYVWTREAIANRAILQPFLDLLGDEDMRWTEQSSYDELAAHSTWGQPMRGERRDTRLLRKLLEPSVAADLGVMSERVGMGGFKQDMAIELKAVIESAREWQPDQRQLFDNCPDPAAREAIWRGFFLASLTKAAADKQRPPMELLNRQRPALQALLQNPIFDKSFDTDSAKGWAYGLVTPDRVYRYNGRDAISTGFYDRMVWQEVNERRVEMSLEMGVLADHHNIRMIWDEVTGPASRSYHYMTMWGAPMDRGAIEGLIWWAQARQTEMVPQLRDYLEGTPFAKINLNSRDQIAGFVYGQRSAGGLGLPILKKTDTGKPSTDKEAFDGLRGKHPFIDLYLQYGAWDGFIEKGAEFLRFLAPDGRIHPTYLLDGTETGRASSQGPNLFNMKRPEDCPTCDAKQPACTSCSTCGGTGLDPVSRRIRDCFAALVGWKLVEVDLSQIEMRGMAALGDDEVLTHAFVNGIDVHTNASIVATRESGTPVSRQEAKPVNFGLAYGLMDSTLAKRLKCPLAKAKKILAAVSGAYRGVARSKSYMQGFTRRYGWTFTVWFRKENGRWVRRLGRQRPLHDIVSGEFMKENTAQNAAFNTPIQGSFSGDLVLAAHADVVAWILGEGLQNECQVVLTVYDSIVLHCRDYLVDAVARKVRELMLSRCIGYTKDGREFPIEADVKVGQTLGDAKKYKLSGGH